MFFGKSKEAESIPESGMIASLNQSFDSKLSGLDEKASRTLEDIAKARNAFEQACERFGALEKEPDTDFIRATSTTYVKEQRGAYLNLMKRILAAHPARKHEGNVYESYHSTMLDIETLLSEVLRANATFKMVLDAYPNDLGPFKKAFGSIEMHWRILKSEIEARGSDLMEYNHLLSQIRSLVALSDEIKELNHEIVQLSSAAPKHADAAEISRLREKIALLNVQRETISRKLAELKSEIGVILGTIDKPARKHDYLSLYKPKLTAMLDNPSLLAQEERYREFCSQVADMKNEIEKGTISVKNANEVRKAIGLVLNGRIKVILESIEELKINKLPLENEMRDIERMLQELNDVVSGASRRETALRDSQARLAEIRKEQEEYRASIELLFSNYYKRRIKII